MIVIDKNSFLALVNNDADSTIMRHVRGSSAKVFVAKSISVEATLHCIGADGLESIRRVTGRIKETGLNVVLALDDLDAAAVDAYDRFGEGNHPASRLTMSDCVAYALAKSLGAKLVSATT